jgi:uncharacterized repeat protein (TIGR03809 family)
MASQLDVAKGREIVARWCNLAEQRLSYLTELFDSGRWRRFHSEEAFLENVREAKVAVEVWRDLLSREASRDNRPIDLSWLGRGRKTSPQNKFQRDRKTQNFEPLEFKPLDSGPPPRSADIPIALPQARPVLPEHKNVAEETRSAEAMSEAAFAAVLDLATIAARYPILRNTL